MFFNKFRIAFVAFALSITPELVQYMAAQKWNGQLPSATSGMPFINIPIR